MSKFLNILRTIFLPILFVSLAFVACEGPAGAKGDIGLTGPKGDTGVSGAEQCGVCHNNSEILFGKQTQWSESVHATGLAASEEGMNKSCAGCHASQGYLEVIKTKADTTVAGFPDANTINCRTCHTIHTKYDATDWTLTNVAPIKLREGLETIDLAKGNLCGQCHQSRVINPKIDLNATTTYKITSSRFGPHNGPMANLFTGKGIFKPNGAASYPANNVHANVPNACITCHMSDGPNPALSGHTMKMASEDGSSQKVQPCLTCHAGEITSKFNDKEGYFSKFQTDMATLKQKLVDKGWWNATSDTWIATSAKPIEVTQNQAAAMFAFRLLFTDKSSGIHNPKLARALLDNAMEVLGQ